LKKNCHVAKQLILVVRGLFFKIINVQCTIQSVKLFDSNFSNFRMVGNDKPGMLDYMIWPWIERLGMFKPIIPDFDFEAAKRENPKLVIISC